MLGVLHSDAGSSIRIGLSVLPFLAGFFVCFLRPDRENSLSNPASCAGRVFGNLYSLTCIRPKYWRFNRFSSDYSGYLDQPTDSERFVAALIVDLTTGERAEANHREELGDRRGD